jgi:hypothetical protein
MRNETLPSGGARANDSRVANTQSTVMTELLSFLDELLSYLESVRDVGGENGRLTGRSSGIERLTKKTRALRDAVSAERQKH